MGADHAAAARPCGPGTSRCCSSTACAGSRRGCGCPAPTARRARASAPPTPPVSSGAVRPSHRAGVGRAPGRARVVAAEVARALFCRAAGRGADRHPLRSVRAAGHAGRRPRHAVAGPPGRHGGPRAPGQRRRRGPRRTARRRRAPRRPARAARHGRLHQDPPCQLPADRDARGDRRPRGGTAHARVLHGRAVRPPQLVPAAARRGQPSVGGRGALRGHGGHRAGAGHRPGRPPGRRAAALRVVAAQGSPRPAEPLPDRRPRARVAPPPGRPAAHPARAAGGRPALTAGSARLRRGSTRPGPHDRPLRRRRRRGGRHGLGRGLVAGPAGPVGGAGRAVRRRAHPREQPRRQPHLPLRLRRSGDGQAGHGGPSALGRAAGRRRRDPARPDRRPRPRRPAHGRGAGRRHGRRRRALRGDAARRRGRTLAPPALRGHGRPPAHGRAVPGRRHGRRAAPKSERSRRRRAVRGRPGDGQPQRRRCPRAGRRRGARSGGGGGDGRRLGGQAPSGRRVPSGCRCRPCG